MGIETIALSALAGSTVIGGLSSISQGRQEDQYQREMARQEQEQAAQERDAAVAQAEKIRRAGRQQSAAADAAFAASGVAIGEGTPVLINEQITRDSEEDAYMSILTGERRGRALDTQAALRRQAGSNARSAGIAGAFGSVLRGAASYGMWGLNKGGSGLSVSKGFVSGGSALNSVPGASGIWGG
ncbi:hypothetical protein RVU96_16775 [Bordetella avium]|uniref:hypothetical protein n=1 Tax=Bordetella avium TaxID=521 RepID=UPI000E0A9339|nr:hypothetical protein [Bordetella avium]RIQ11568.1 hypothetical protein D0432_16295 [Bordetella avium]RIQ44933.1 hypothetical protein D0845_17145 [Bordetella avium]RIQ49583.1 hypothetical protein D0844_16440 [Bordetella avium]RIQ55320.1 hypothetical protein D0841_16510 [Bordetella avium]RIQ58428.1 hypothetical protein D0842_16535 [Bordetella avium]